MGGGLRGKSPWSTSIHCWGGSHLTHIREGFASEKKQTFAVNTTQRAGEGCDPSPTAKQSSTCRKEAMRP